MTVRRIAMVVAIVALVGAVGGAAVAWSNGMRYYAVDSGSMAPTFDKGSLVVDEPITATTVLRVGDVITFHPTPNYTTTHRIAAIGPEGITTKGDANPSADVGRVRPDMVVGRVAFSLPLGGYAAMFLRQPTGIGALLVLILAVSLAWRWRPRRRRIEAPT